jgi:cytochrome c-type biogenesis protein
VTIPALLQSPLIPLGLGLLGFVEPCSIGSSLIFVKYMEGKGPGPKIAEVSLFMATRALIIGLLGMLAAVFGIAFLGFQKAMWIAFGAVYVVIGLLYLFRRISPLMISFGPSLARLSGLRGSAGLGLLFGLYIPACAAPLIFALLGSAAAGGAAGGGLAGGFASLALFGIALSLPLVAAVLFAPARRGLDWLAGLSVRLPFWTGVVLIALGLWAIGFALFAHIKA